ncbi:hypothetical protein CVU5213_03000 [Campylobacter vulpis]|uniref:Uncharacterized protein n=1 Tax=Campylobacter vulpis TaxID=1655500 RepID=A0A2G4R252_9BACT|nr:hypothetical protein [Campylobacter vulpis]MBS4235277.1 hypothetical protein [Campylobacter vulpis]MBS4240705.1 hypothetical protein [Campylobacter vulpis]MBS4252263.1 hypothetical protein [Campylobacter vulpis]MBS4281890.1 hypothetical protein [Campylobacter vulpis]MBS4313206.1 hypothetical protein [Campylobacter vulpis]
MANPHKEKVLKMLQDKYGGVKALPKTQSLFIIEALNIVLYFRYSKLSNYGKNDFKSFYGLRVEDLKFLQGKKAFIIFLSDFENKSIVLPFSKIEALLSQVKSAKDGQYKALAFFKHSGAELYFSQFAKFKIDFYLGLKSLFNFEAKNTVIPHLTHSEAQGLLGIIGQRKGFDIYYPSKDRVKIPHKISNLREHLPLFNPIINPILDEIDCIWLKGDKMEALFEVEHSTPIYSGLLRFNDAILSVANLSTLNIVADENRELKFHKELMRPTFKQNNLVEKVSFMSYANLYEWYLQ